jgi:hypothetical protein
MESLDLQTEDMLGKYAKSDDIKTWQAVRKAIITFWQQGRNQTHVC